jgi:histidinol dehydrogenase
MLELIKYPQRKDWKVLLERPAIDLSLLENKVSGILTEVKQSGDEALKRLTLQFDKIELRELKVSEEEMRTAENFVSSELKQAIQIAKNNIERFHVLQKEEMKKLDTMKGVSCWRKSVPIEKIGLYIPGGSAPLFSTVLMLGIPAKLAGCKEIILCTPCGKEGTIDPAILYTAKVVGIDTIYKAGGAQAIAAMAYGTATIPKVYKIFGPGNQYVTCAKQLVNKEGIAIDMPAGPSEVAILADSTCIPAFVAADLLSQAEHGTDSQVILVSDSGTVLRNVNEELEYQLEALPRKEIAAKALKNSKAILVESIDDGLGLLNAYAPEHLIIACDNDEELAGKVVNAGSVFLGNYSCESAGDYASGTNHTLPTNGFARSYSGVSVDSFVKKITFQKITEEGIHNIGRTIQVMAEAEGLFAHKNAVSIRMKNRELRIRL